MRIENLFKQIPGFENIVMDTVLFESTYPILFTCTTDEEIYLFICCYVNSEKIKWIGTKTTYDNLINLLKNRITIRDAFLNITSDKLIIDYDGKNIDYKYQNYSDIPEFLLPTAGEYMDAEIGEYAEEIADFEKRNTNIEYVIKPKVSKLIEFRFDGRSTFVLDKYSKENSEFKEVVHYKVEKISNRVVLA